MIDLDKNYAFHEPREDQFTRYQMIRDDAKKLAELIRGACPESREKSLAFTKREEAVMWANAAIARNEEE